MSYFYIDTLPRVYLDNKTSEAIENIKAKAANEQYARVITSIHNVNLIGTKVLKMYHCDKNNIKKEYEIFDRLTDKYRRYIRVEILAIKEDGTLEIKVTPTFQSGV